MLANQELEQRLATIEARLEKSIKDKEDFQPKVTVTTSSPSPGLSALTQETVVAEEPSVADEDEDALFVDPPTSAKKATASEAFPDEEARLEAAKKRTIQYRDKNPEPTVLAANSFGGLAESVASNS